MTLGKLKTSAESLSTQYPIFNDRFRELYFSACDEVLSGEKEHTQCVCVYDEMVNIIDTWMKSEKNEQ